MVKNPTKRESSNSPLTILTSNQELRAFQFSHPDGTNSRLVGTGYNNNRTSFVEERSSLMWPMPQKRPSQTLSSGSVEDLEEIQPKVFSGNHLAKRSKVPTTRPFSSSTIMSSLSRPSLDIAKAKTVLPEQTDSVKATEDQFESDRSRTLRSPFKYTQEFVDSQVNSGARKDTQLFDPKAPSPKSRTSRYMYFAPMNPSVTTVLAADAYGRVPRRQLSYGTSSSKPRPRSLHKSNGSWELRHEAERHVENHKIETRSNSVLDAPLIRPYQDEHIRSKARLWLDSSEQRDDIQEAVSIPKPEKAQVQLPKSILMVYSTLSRSKQARQSLR